MGVTIALLAGAESHLLGISSHLTGARASFPQSQTEEQGGITGKHAPLELRTDFKSSLPLGTERPEAGLCRELRLVGQNRSGDGRGQVKRLGPEAELAREHNPRSHGSGRGGSTGRTPAGEGGLSCGVELRAGTQPE